LNLCPQIVDPIRYPDWDELFLRTPSPSFFHSAAWARVLSESYGYTPLYFTVIEGGKLRVLVPLMEVDSFLTGKRGVSLPFTDYCESILEEGVVFQELFNPIIDYGKKRGWKYIELRSGDRLVPRSPFLVPGFSTNNEPFPGNPAPSGTAGNMPFITYFGHTLDLTKGETALYSGLRGSTRRNIKKAEKEKVKVRIENTPGAVAEFYRLNCLTRHEHGLPPQPYHFFRNLYREVISKGNGFVALGYVEGKAAAGNVYFHFGRQASYKYGASDKRYQSLRASNLVMWEAIKRFCGEGFKSLCFGRTEPENDGLRQFKRGWGTEEHPIHYFRYDLRQSAYVTGKQRGEPRYTGLFRVTPAPVLNVIGSLLYKHVG
jgi:hypothetical protein